MTDSSLTDPSELTTQALQREVTSLEKLMTQRIESIEKAVSVAHEDLVRVPTEITKEITHLEKLYDEKFRGIDKQFELRDKRDTQTWKDSKDAVAAALQAAKELVGEQSKSSGMAIFKSEASTGKQIDAMDGKINDLKDRVIIIEGTSKGRSDMWGWVVAAAAILVSVAIAVLK